MMKESPLICKNPKNLARSKTVCTKLKSQRNLFKSIEVMKESGSVSNYVY